jgi:hypothetical protein
MALLKALSHATGPLCKTRSGFDEYGDRVVTQGIASSEWPRSGTIHSRRCPGLLNRTPLKFAGFFPLITPLIRYY